MRSSLLLALLFTAPFSLSAQEIPNGGFESWQEQFLFEQPTEWDSGNYEDGTAISTTAVTNAPQGTLAARIETVENEGEPTFGYVLLGRFLEDVPGLGVPFTTNIANLECQLRYDIAPNDTAIALLTVWSGGNIVSGGEWRFHGQQNAWTPTVLPLPLVATNVDSVLVGFASSDPFSGTVNTTVGSWLEVDAVRLTHPGVPVPDQLPNWGFEEWEDISIEDPMQWGTYNSFTAGYGLTPVTKSSDAQAGSFSARIETLGAFGDTLPGVLTNGIIGSNGPDGGVPYVAMPTLFTGAYKYLPAGQDTAIIGVIFKAGGTIMGSAVQTVNSAQPTWIPMSVPVLMATTPDTMLVAIYSGDNPGSVLYVDALNMSGGTVGVGENTMAPRTPWPVPATEVLNVPNVAAGTALRLFDAKGVLVRSARAEVQGTQLIGLEGLAAGAYTLELRDGTHTERYPVVKAAY